MHLYDSRVGAFIPRATSGQIADALSRNFLHSMDQHASPSEVKSWRNSLGAFAEAVNGTGMDESWIVLEYQLPLSSARLDAMLLGSDNTGKRNAVIMEFKQWDSCEAHYAPGVVRVGGEEKLHPSAQALAYKRYLADTHTAFVNGDVGLASAAYLHNLRREKGSDFFADGYKQILQESPIFSAEKVEDLTRFVGERIRGGAEQALVEAVLNGEYRPSKTLLANVAKAIEGYRPWQLLDEQLVVFHTILADIRRARREGSKKVIVIRGGPGTGKSVIAAQLAGMAAKEQFSVAHATGSKAFTTNMRGAVGKEAAAVFTYTNEFNKARQDLLDLIVVDEAHRLREQSTNFFGKVIDATPQWERITDAARVSVYLLDERQNVKSGEAGSVKNIEAYAKARGFQMSEYTLKTQFRCAGSESYVRWVEYTLGLRPDNALAWKTQEQYEVVIHDRVEEMESALRAKAAAGKTARLVAGFCWPWSDARADNTLVPDVTIGGWSMPWNRKAKGSPAPEVHPYTIWASQPEGINEVGCVYSAQGFEFDYIGVIWGPDLRWDEKRQRWVSDIKASKDTGWKKGLSEQPDVATEQLQHIYRVLATRGMKGAHFYFLDEATKRRFLDTLESA